MITILAVALYCTACIPVVLGVGLTWHKLRRGSVVPSDRRDAGIDYDPICDFVLLFGGRQTKDVVLDDTWIYDVNQSVWEPVMVHTHPPARHSFVSSVSQSYFYVAMGEGRSGLYYSDVWRFDIINMTWEELPSQRRPPYISPADWLTLPSNNYTPAPRGGAAGGIYPGAAHLYVSHGYNGSYVQDTVVYDLIHQAWDKDYSRGDCALSCEVYNPYLPHPRSEHAAVLIGPRLFLIFGGCLSGGGSGGPCPSSDSWLYDGVHKEWRQVNSDCIPPRTHAAMSMLPLAGGERRIVLYGGVEATSQVLMKTGLLTDDIAVFNVQTGIWSVKKTLSGWGYTPPTLRSSAAMATGPTGVYMFGGMEDDTNQLLNDLWLLEGDSLSADQSEASSCSPQFLNMIMLHGMLMVIGWAFFLQWGAFMKRYLRSEKPTWFYVHVSFQLLGLLCAVAGFVFGVLSVRIRDGHFRFLHSIVGLIVMVLGITQPIMAMFRPMGKSMKSRNERCRLLWWKSSHQLIGWLTLGYAFINITLGVFLALSSQLLWALWLGYFGLVVLSYIIAQFVQRIKKYHGKGHVKNKLNNLDHNGLTTAYATAGYASESSRL